MAVYTVTKEKDGIVYGVTPNKTLFVTNAKNAKYSNNLMIPSEVQGIPVTGVANGAFISSKAKHVLFPASVTYVGENAFKANVNIKSIIFQAEEVEIAQSAFEGCFKLQQVAGKHFNLSGARVFCHCKNMTEINGRMKGTIHPSTFAFCKRLEALSFNDNIVIHNEAFYGCMSIRAFMFETNASIAPTVMKFVEKRKIYCHEDSPLVEMIYNGTDVQVI